jgi:fructose-1,6-bisphosphatase I
MAFSDSKSLTLKEYLSGDQQDEVPGKKELHGVLTAISKAGKMISRAINSADITGLHGMQGSTNVHGDKVKKLDIYANEMLISELESCGDVCVVISEENEEPVHLNSKEGRHVVYFDPIDGSANLDINVTTGTIFSVYSRKTEIGEQPDEKDVLQMGSEQVAAGYVLYGPGTVMVFTTGSGVHVFTHDSDSGQFILTVPYRAISPFGTIYSVNHGDSGSWGKGLKKYIEYCLEDDSVTGRPFLCRYIGSMVADIHRTLQKGGIYIFPPTNTYPSGKLRLMYECNPLSFIIEQAGGMAIDGKKRIMEIEPAHIHQQTPVYIGSPDNVDQVAGFLEKYPADGEGI